jgi:hypothetical protein
MVIAPEGQDVLKKNTTKKTGSSGAEQLEDRYTFYKLKTFWSTLS